MKQISLLLLLLIGIAGAHENDDIDSDQHSFGEFMMTGSGDEHDEHNDHDDTQEVRVKWSTDAVLNALMAFGINDTAFRPGQIICPSSNLGSSYKESKVTVGVVGCKLDPLISHYTPQQRKLLQGHHDDDIYESLNCTDTINIAGYFPPVPEYIISLWIAAQEINNSPLILPHHRICLQLALSPAITKVLAGIFDDVIHDDIPVLVDASPSRWFSVIQGLVLPHGLPIVRYSTGQMDFATTEELITVFQELPLHVFDRKMSSDYLQNLVNQYFFSVGPDTTIPIKALCGLARGLGWKHIGIIIANDEATHVDTRQVYIGHLDLRIVLVQYVESNPYDTFEALFDNEIKILVYHGPPSSYIDVLHVALGYGFVENENVWILPYHNVVFPEDYLNVWCRYSKVEVYRLKNALRGSLMLGISEGMGPERDKYRDHFHEEAFNITGDDIYVHHRNFMQTAYIHDSLHVISDALDKLVKAKAVKQNLTVEQIEITMEDRSLLTDKLRSLAFFGGITGNVSFTKFGRRKVSQVDLRNFVPIDNTNFSVNTSLIENPWIVQTRGCLEVFADGRIELVYLDENGNILKVPTIVFHDGTTNIPLDRPYRVFVRSNTRVFLTTTISSLIFLVSVAVYATMIYYEDRKALLYNSNWIHREEDVDFLLEEQGIKGRLTNVQALRSGFGKKGQDNVGRLKHGGAIVDVIKIDFKRSALTSKVYEEANLLMDLKHQNICMFRGCLLTESYTALFFEHCTRGSLENILLRSDIQFDWIFKISFALDAAQAMAFLHSKKIIHGRLSTMHCMIDEEWTLKIQDYGLQSLHAPQKRATRKRTQWNKVAPEIRFLGVTWSQAGDVYAYGHILEELSVIKCLPTEQTDESNPYSNVVVPNRPLRISTQGLSRNNDNNPKFIKLQQRCHNSNPQHRPSFEEIKIALQQMSDHFSTRQDKEHKGILQVYTRKLEEKVDWLSELLRQEKEHSNDFMQNYFPRKLATAIRMGKKIPLSQQTNKTILSLEMTNTELLLKHMTPEMAENVIVTMQKAIEGVTRSFCVQKLYSTGTTWILATVLEEDTLSNHISEAVNAAIAILENFSGIFLPGLPDKHPTLRLGLHTGDFICGVAEDPVPQFVAYGKSIECTKQLMLASKDGKILASEAVAKELEREQGFIVTYNKDIEFANLTTATFWIEEDSNTQSNILTPSVAHTDSRVTIKSRMRKSTIRSTPKNSYSSNTLRRKSNPPPMTKKQGMAATAFMSSGVPLQRSSATTTRSMAAVALEKMGRTWSTVSEPPDIATALSEEDAFTFMSGTLPPV